MLSLRSGKGNKVLSELECFSFLRSFDPKLGFRIGLHTDE